MGRQPGVLWHHRLHRPRRGRGNGKGQWREGGRWESQHGRGPGATELGRGMSGLKHASSAAVPLALLHSTTLSHTSAPVPSTCPASLWKGDGHRSQSLASSEVQGRALAQRDGGAQRWGNPKGEGRGERLREGEGQLLQLGERLPQALGSPHLISLGSEV